MSLTWKGSPSREIKHGYATFRRTRPYWSLPLAAQSYELSMQPFVMWRLTLTPREP